MFNRRHLLAAFVAGMAGISALPALAQEKIRFAVTDVDGLESLPA